MSWSKPPEIADAAHRQRYEDLKLEYEILRTARRAREATFLGLRQERDALHWENVDLAQELRESTGWRKQKIRIQRVRTGLNLALHRNLNFKFQILFDRNTNWFFTSVATRSEVSTSRRGSKACTSAFDSISFSINSHFVSEPQELMLVSMLCESKQPLTPFAKRAGSDLDDSDDSRSAIKKDNAISPRIRTRSRSRARR